MSPADSILLDRRITNTYCEEATKNLDDSEKEESSSWDDENIFNKEPDDTGLKKDEKG